MGNNQIKRVVELSEAGYLSSSGKSYVISYSKETLYGMQLSITALRSLNTKALPDNDSSIDLGDNVVGEIKEGQLILYIDRDAPSLGLSSTGKSELFANTHGFASIGGGYSVSVLLTKRV